MHIESIFVENYGPFQGQHKVNLEPTVYGVVARHDSDPGRSNWLGKSWAMNAARYALYGGHFASSEDEVIHRGESLCEVVVRLSDGTSISRSRKRGSSTKLKVDIAGQKTFLLQDRAQEAIIKHLRMTSDDFDASCFIRQKQIARMVTARPAERTDIVNAWLELEKLVESEDIAKNHLRELLDKKQTAESRIEVVQEVVARGLKQQECLTLVERLEAELEEIGARHAKALKELTEERERQLYVKRAEDFERILTEGREMKTELDMAKSEIPDTPDVDGLESMKAELVELRAEARSCKTLASGQFDGQCPVMKQECPARKGVESTRVDASRRLKVLEQEIGNRESLAQELSAKVQNFDSAQSHIAVTEKKLEFLREQAKRLADADDYLQEHPSHGKLEDLVRLESSLTDEVIAKSAEIQSAKKSFDDWLDGMAQIKKLRETVLKGLDREIETAMECIAVLKDSRKAIAVQALVEIENLANDLLVQASIDLKISVSWGREGKGLASNCDSCGAPFPSSQKVVTCTKCQSARGQKVIERLDLELSNRSGAAEDMAGLAFQLAASAWLRKRRSSDWGVVFVDEPFGALDETNTRNLSNHLHALIRNSFGFEQGFLVAHDASIMGAMPAKLVITSDGSSSKLEVV